MNAKPLMTALEDGTQLHRAGSLNRAESIYRSILKRDPKFVPALMNLGSLLRQRGRHIDAIGLYKHALTYEPRNSSLLSNLGHALHQIGLVDEAIDSLKRAIEYDPNNSLAYDNLGHIHSRLERYDEALALLEKAIRVDPDNANAWNNLAGVHLAQCRMEESLECFRKAVELKPDFTMAHSNVLFGMNFSPACTAEQISEESRNWNEKHALLLKESIPPHPVRDPNKSPLRLGFVSFDFKEHPVGRFLAPLFHSRKPGDWQAVCYSDVLVPDRRTEWFRSKSDLWRDTAGLTDVELAQLIRRDQIDVLIDLAGHTAGNRLLVFARKPAPVQASWIGYFNTTGMEAMDYLIADKVCVLPEHEHLYTEEIIRMPDDFLCYEPPPAPNVGPLPALKRGYVTFCSFNQLAKVSDAALQAWAEILERLPTARLVLRGKALNDVSVRDRYASRLLELGVSRERVDLLPKASLQTYLATYNDVDIALDSFPFVGGTTTCDALWMGVPVITFLGARFCHRHSASHLINAGFPELVAEGLEDYINRAVALATDTERLSDLRSRMRERLAASPLVDAERFAESFHQCLRAMWTDAR